MHPYRAGNRGRGISHALLEGAVEFARDHGAPVIEGYPVDNRGEKVDLTMAYVGTSALFKRAGFKKASDTPFDARRLPSCADATRPAVTTTCW